MQKVPFSANTVNAYVEFSSGIVLSVTFGGQKLNFYVGKRNFRNLM